MNVTDQVLAQLDSVRDDHRQLRSRADRDDSDSEFEPDFVRVITRARAVIQRVADAQSPYVEQCKDIVGHDYAPGYTADMVIAVVDALRSDVAAGYLISQRQLIHGELFSDFLEMAQHLLEEGYKDAAAVIAGSSLEAHLRQLCAKHSIDIETLSDGQMLPKKADRLNSDLAKVQAYSKNDQKSVTAWLGLRNSAAHGQYDQYNRDQVNMMIEGLRNFIVRLPA